MQIQPDPVGDQIAALVARVAELRQAKAVAPTQWEYGRLAMSICEARYDLTKIRRTHRRGF